MNATTWRKIVALGTMTGMRSMAGVATLAWRRGGRPSSATLVLAVGEMVLDKAPFVPARTASLPFAGRVVAGAVVGGVIARRDRGNIWLGALAGAATAAIATHVAYQVRKRVPLLTPVCGALEDLVVVGIGAMTVHDSSVSPLPPVAVAVENRRRNTGGLGRVRACEVRAEASKL